MEGWMSTTGNGYWPEGNSRSPDGSAVVTYMAGAVWRRGESEIVVPVVRSQLKDIHRPEDEASFLEFFRWLMEHRGEVTDDPIQIWLPEPEPVRN